MECNKYIKHVISLIPMGILCMTDYICSVFMRNPRLKQGEVTVGLCEWVTSGWNPCSSQVLPFGVWSQWLIDCATQKLGIMTEFVSLLSGEKTDHECTDGLVELDGSAWIFAAKRGGSHGSGEKSAFCLRVFFSSDWCCLFNEVKGNISYTYRCLCLSLKVNQWNR